MTHGSLFTGIGGFDLGFRRAGIETVWQAENNRFCQQVLARRFPGVPLIKDVRDIYRFAHEYPLCICCGEEPWCERHQKHFGDCTCIGCSEWDDEWITPDIISGGFPCQDISRIGDQAGLAGERSGLWREMRRIVEHLRPRYVVMENVAILLGSEFGRVLGDLAEIGYDAEWDCLPAFSVGALHIRDRVFLVGYPGSSRLEGHAGHGAAQGQAHPPRSTGEAGLRARAERRQIGKEHWATEPAVGRVAHGIPQRLLRSQLEALGNAVVPQIAEWIGRRILAAEERHAEVA